MDQAKNGIYSITSTERGWKSTNTVAGVVLEAAQPETDAVSVQLDDEPSRPTITPLVVPTYTSASYVMGSVQHGVKLRENGPYHYSRNENVTREALEGSINTLEEGAGSLVFSSGMAAVSAVLVAFLKPGDQVIAPLIMYPGTKTFMNTELVEHCGIEVTYVDASKGVDEYRANIQKNTKVLYGETPCHTLEHILDLEAFGELGRTSKILTMVDATLASPYLLKPLKYGIDISIHNCSEYMNGHSDVIAGCLTVLSLDHWRKLKHLQINLGNALDPFGSYLLHRGLKTIHVRMDRHCSNAMEIAKLLHVHPKVTEIYYPGLPTHAGHDLAKRQMRNFGGMICFGVEGGADAARNVLQSLQLITQEASPGGVESSAVCMDGHMYTKKEQLCVEDKMIRLSVGLENVNDLKTDLTQALEKIPLESNAFPISR